MAHQNREFGENPQIYNRDKYEDRDDGGGGETNDVPVNVDPFLYDYTPRFEKTSSGPRDWEK